LKLSHLTSFQTVRVFLISLLLFLIFEKGNGQFLCSGTREHYFPVPVNAANIFQWNIIEGEAGSDWIIETENTAGTYIIWIAPGLYTLIRIETDIDGNEFITRSEITVIPEPVAMAGPDTTLQYVFKIRMAAEEPKLYEEGKWTVTTGSAVFEDDSDPNTLVSDLGLGENILLWTVSNGICPASEDFISVKTFDLEIPTLITPNGDPYNEYFLLRGIETLGITNLVIFDRRGVLVYKEDNYRNDWNGLDNNGVKLPENTYFYTLKSQNGRSASGYIVIRR
jgi:gliding motility-associated-like protein